MRDMSLDRQALMNEEDQRFRAALPAFRRNPEPFLIFPELNLTEPVGLWDNFAPAATFFPFYNTLVLLLEPFKDRRFFSKYYGVDLDDLIRLTRERKIAPLLTTRYTEYPRYFDPLFREFFVPNAHRFEVAMSAIRLGSTEVYRDCEKTVRERIGTTPIEPFILRSHYWLKEFGVDSRKNLLTLTAQNLARMRILGYDGLVHALEKLSNPNAFLHWVLTIAPSINRPSFFSLGGWTNLHPELFRVGRAILSKWELQADMTKIVPATSSLLAALSVKLRYGHPDNYPPFEFASKIGDLSEVKENQKILADIRRHIEQGDSKAFGEAQEAIEIMKALDHEILKVARGYKITKYAIHPAFAVLSAAGAATVESLLTGQPPGSTPTSIYFPILASIATGVADMSVSAIRENLDKVSEMLAGSLARVGTAPILLWKRQRRT